MVLPIAEYAVVGDRHTMALVGRDGSIDWLCLPQFDSPSCFTALLGDPDRSRWLLGPDPTAPGTRSIRRYLEDTNVLETTHRTATGTVRVTDLMPTGERRADLIRRIEGVEGEVELEHEFVIRFDYGRIRPWVRREEAAGEEVIVAVAGPDKLILSGPRLPTAHQHTHRDRIVVRAGDRLDFALTWVHSFRPLPPPLDVDELLRSTTSGHRAWVDEYHDDGPYREAVRRSLLVLHALTHEDTGGVVAAPTASLPEDFGGPRNWDYRFSWLRDAALTVEAMTGDSRPDRAAPWRDWLLRAVAGDPVDLQVMYTVDGGRHLPEIELDHLEGYQGSRPVRIGNGAVGQRQNDVVGEVIGALARARVAGLRETADSWSLQRTLINCLVDDWDQPDHGIWEIRGPSRRFTHSRIMMWVAFDRGVRAIEEHGLDGPLTLWREQRDRIREVVMTTGVSPVTGAFRQHDETDEVDASLLLASTAGFVAGDDPVMLATIAAVEKDLIRDGLVLRYRTETGVDGIEGAEYPFLACSFWLVSAYARAGRQADAEALMDRLLALRNDVGLLSEEYDAGGGRMAGNFPQAFSHLALVKAARTLHRFGTSTGLNTP